MVRKMSEYERYYCDDVDEYRDYAIFDLDKSDKTIEDFWNEEEECLECAKFTIYLYDETESMLKSDEIVDELNDLYAKSMIMEKVLQNCYDRLTKYIEEMPDEIVFKMEKCLIMEIASEVGVELVYE